MCKKDRCREKGEDRLFCWDMLWSLLYPPRCLLCYELLEDGEQTICSHCAAVLPEIAEPICLKCGKAIDNDGMEYCSDCREHPHLFEYGRALFSYTKEVQEAIVRYKYKNQRGYAAWFGDMMAKRFAEEIWQMQAQVLVPVPLYIKKERVRGFNQAELLARVIGERCGLPVQKLLKRRRKTEAQKELGYEDRLANLEGSFQIIEPGEEMPEAVILVDDIYTTGSTVDACAAVLKKAGVKRVYFLAVAIGNC